MNEIEEITIETLRRLSPSQRWDAIKRRQKWLVKVREEEKLEVNRSISRKIRHNERYKTLLKLRFDAVVIYTVIVKEEYPYYNEYFFDI